MKRRTIITTGALIGAAALCAAALIFSRKNGREHITFETAAAAIGTIRIMVTATGTVQPIDQVDVGTQVSGVVQKVFVDYNSRVKKGQLIARLDTTNLKAALALSSASVRSAKTELDFQSKNYRRVKALFEKNLVSSQDLEKAQYSFESAGAALEKAEADLQRAQTNLAYASIYSPIDGIVLARAVDEGQTVAASFNTPTLFKIARDLTKMEIQADVDEADIGQVRQEQRVTFTVDAYPGLIFNGTVTQIRLEPKTTANVVTYPVIITADNPDMKLMPGMTATVSIYTEEAEGVLTIPAKALRFRPDSALLYKYFKKHMAGRKGPPPGLRPEHTAGPQGRQAQSPMLGRAGLISDTRPCVWVKKDNIIIPKHIQTGISDGTALQVLSGLEAGEEVVVSMNSGDKKKSDGAPKPPAVSPFMPRRPGSAGPRSGR